MICLFFSFPSYGEWRWELFVEIGDYRIFLDKNKFRSSNGFVYFYELEDLQEPFPEGMVGPYKIWSRINYFKGDCNDFKYKLLDSKYFLEPMGKNLFYTDPIGEGEWKFSLPDSIGYEKLNVVCSLTN